MPPTETEGHQAVGIERPRLLVFDLDGTLVDSRRDIAEAANQLLETCGGAALPVDAVTLMVGDGAATLVHRLFAAAAVAEPADSLERFLGIYDGRLLRHTRPYPGVGDMLAELAAQVPLAVLTNKPAAASLAILGGLGLDRYFGEVLGGDGPWPRKPDPQALLALIDTHQATAATTVMIGDSGIDLRTARRAGTRGAIVRYGFGFDRIDPGDWADTDLVVDEASGLLALVASG